MPTGYTADLYEGKDVSFRDFVLHCAMAFGLAIMQRDTNERVPRRLNDSYLDYERKSVKEAEDEVRTLTARTEADWKNAYRQYCTDTAEYNRRSRESSAKVATSYQGMLAQVKAWDVSDAQSDLLPNLKKFMIDQIEMCKNEGEPFESPIKDFDEWKKDEITWASRRLANATTSLREAEERLAGQQRNYDDLMAHL